MNKTILTFVGGVVILAFVFFAVANALFFSNVTPSAAVVLPSVNAQNAAPSGDVQVINLSAQGINYTPSVITVKQNQPVRLIANVASLQGCLKSFKIPALGIQTIFTETNNKVEFTPTQKGSFPFSCAMGMGRGTINVI